MLHQFHLPGHPEILTVSNIIENGKPVGLGDAGKYWHSDISHKALPSLGSLLHAQELPSEGGDTLFANMHLAYDTLPEALRNAIEGRRAVHSYRQVRSAAKGRQLASEPERATGGASAGSLASGCARIRRTAAARCS